MRAERNLKKVASDSGADIVGIASVDRFSDAPKMMHPQALLPETKSVIVAAVRYARMVIERFGRPPGEYLGYGAFQEEMNLRLRRIAMDVTRHLEADGFAALPIPPTNVYRRSPYKGRPGFCADFSNRHAAVAAGMGEFGWSGLVLTEQYGPRQRFVSVLTDAEFLPDPMYNGPELCDGCGLCVTYCPMGAVKPIGSEPKTCRIAGREFRYSNTNLYRCAYSEDFQCATEEGPRYGGRTADEYQLPEGDIGEKELVEASRISAERRAQSERLPSVGVGTMGRCLAVCLPPHLRKKYSNKPGDDWRRVDEQSQPVSCPRTD